MKIATLWTESMSDRRRTSESSSCGKAVVCASVLPKSPKEMSRVQKRMVLAGYHGLGPAVVFTACECVGEVLPGKGGLPP